MFRMLFINLDLEAVQGGGKSVILDKDDAIVDPTG